MRAEGYIILHPEITCIILHPDICLYCRVCIADLQTVIIMQSQAGNAADVLILLAKRDVFSIV